MKIIEMNLNIGIIFNVPKDSNEHLFRMFLRQFVKYAWFNIAIPNKISIFIKKMFDYIERTIENKMVMETIAVVLHRHIVVSQNLIKMEVCY